MGKKKKVRTEFRKNRASRTRPTDWTKKFETEELDEEAIVREERVSGKGELTRHRTVRTTEPAAGESGDVLLDVDRSQCLAGRVLSVRGLISSVRADNGEIYQCATRRLLKTLATEQRHVVAAGDRVLFRSAGGGQHEGIIERVEPRETVLSRESRGRQHIIVTNVDQVLVVASADQPPLKPNLIDRFLIAAEKARVQPLICINKIDLVEPATLQPLVGIYSQMGYRVLLASARTGFGIERLRRRLAGHQNAVAGQSGVGKSSLLNAIEPELQLRIGAVSRETHKGTHTTTTAQLLPLSSGGYVVDTPGMRQFQLWDVIREEVANYYRDLRPFVSLCKFPDCTHTHEEDCAVKDAVADNLLDERRYESYLHLFAGDHE